MALLEKHRSSIYRSLVPLLGEEEAQAMLAELPSTDLDVPATKDFVRAEIADVRTELRTGLADVRTELRTGLADVRTELRTGLADLRTEMHSLNRQTVIWMVGAMLAISSAQTAVVLAFS